MLKVSVDYFDFFFFFHLPKTKILQGSRTKSMWACFKVDSFEVKMNGYARELYARANILDMLVQNTVWKHVSQL